MKFKNILITYIPATIISCIYPIYLYFKTGNPLYFVDVQFEYWGKIATNIFTVFFKAGKIIFNDDELADTVVKKDAAAQNAIKDAYTKLNDYSKYEAAAETYKEILALESEKREKSTASAAVYTLFFSTFSNIEAYLLLFFIISLLMWFCGQNPST